MVGRYACASRFKMITNGEGDSVLGSVEKKLGDALQWRGDFAYEAFVLYYCVLGKRAVQR